MTAVTDQSTPTPTRADGPKPVFEGTKRHGEQFALYTFVIVPFLAFLAAIPVAWGWGLNWTDVTLFVIFYVVSGLGITVGYHRLFTHGSFKAKRPLRIALAIAGSLAIEGPVIRWVADHRRHHAYSDRDGDPHSPWRYGETTHALLKGLCYAHIGWLFDEMHTNREKYAPDLWNDKDIRLVDKLFPAWGAAVGVRAGGHRRAGGRLLGRGPVGVLLGLAGAHLPLAPRDLVDQLDLPHDRRAAVLGPGPEHELLAARDPELR